jgi:hypothetical protein
VRARARARVCGAAQIVEMIRTESIVPLTLEGESGETLDLQAWAHAHARARTHARARIGVQEFFEKLEKYRTDKVDVLVKKCAQKKRTILLAAATVCTLAVIPTFVPLVRGRLRSYSDYQ